MCIKMKSTALPLPTKQNERSTVPIFKIIFAKKGIFFLFSVVLTGLAFLSARCNILTYCSPFALALACAVPGEFLPAAVIGASVGYLTSGYEIVPARYLAALIVAVIIKRIFSEKTANNPLFCGTLALLCAAGSGIVTSLLLDEVQTTLIPYTAESFIAGAAGVFWAAGANQIRRMKSLRALTESESACILISIFLIILSLSYIHIFDFSLARILACFTILICAFYGKTGGGALAGIGAGIALGFGNEDTFAFSGLAIGGLFAGLGATHSKVLSAIALEAGIAVPLLFGIGESVDYMPFAEAGIAALLFFLLPKKRLTRLSFLNAATYSPNAATIQAHTLSRLRFASDALGDVCRSVETKREKNAEMLPPKKTSVYVNTMQKTCEKCGLKYYCWEREKEYTVSIFKKIEKMLELEKELTPETLPNNFGNTCIRNKVLIKNFTAEHTAYFAGKLAARRAAGMREVMRVQFDALSQLLYDLSDTIEQKELLDADLTEALSDLLEYCGVEYTSAGVFIGKDFKIKVNIKVPYRQEVMEKAAFSEDLQSICSHRFEPANITRFDTCFKYSFYERAAYACDCGYYQISAKNNKYCGDCVEICRDYSGKCATVLADGMGNGYAANLSATLSAAMMSKLIEAGFSTGSAIKVVNAALMVKDADESFSSLDLALFDLYTGKTDFYKAGAAFSVFVKNGKSGKVELSSMPVGILDQADFAHTSLTLGDGDAVILVSDGVTQGNSEWILTLAENARAQSARELAKEIAQKAKANTPDTHEDDISVAVMRIGAAEKDDKF